MKIKQTYTTNGYDYTLIKAEQISPKMIKALYKQGEKAYEVQVIRLRESFNGTQWMNPSNSRWGRDGWTFINRDLADAKFDNI